MYCDRTVRASVFGFSKTSLSRAHDAANTYLAWIVSSIGATQCTELENIAFVGQHRTLQKRKGGGKELLRNPVARM